jgi:hypothetical protein
MPENKNGRQRGVLPIPDRNHVGVRWVKIDFAGDAEDSDHLITPDEGRKIAMARQ